MNVVAFPETVPAVLNETVPVPATNVPLFVKFPFTFNVPVVIVKVAPDSITTSFALTIVPAATEGCCVTHALTGIIVLVVLFGETPATV